MIYGEDNSGSMTSKSKRNAFSPQKEEGKSKLNARSNGMLVVMVINMIMKMVGNGDMVIVMAISKKVDCKNIMVTWWQYCRCSSN